MRSLGLLILLITGTAQAGLDVTLNPHWCVAAAGASSCKAELSLDWQQTQATPLCLYREDKPLTCWPAQEKGQWQGQVEASGSILFWLGTPEGERLWEGQWQVLFTQPLRRRNRMPWSIH
ncbi:DUF3019 domain-containing protein [Gallaecimonas kandeliae]|uniref:DUF3019 domain-containing protein n=1 Tax=Gallaecimonas kandeliae TaxID=3029055 RepID=UPI00264A2F1C|nr:DUF3019 domain-containing protein [Gallaecimonas kandeliae]WKE65291.1 DUF3019 domain-containing protein [Gallaecimonas kandeliae]